METALRQVVGAVTYLGEIGEGSSTGDGKKIGEK
jgi:hypothetical protein